MVVLVVIIVVGEELRSVTACENYVGASQGMCAAMLIDAASVQGRMSMTCYLSCSLTELDADDVLASLVVRPWPGKLNATGWSKAIYVKT